MTEKARIYGNVFTVLVFAGSFAAAVLSPQAMAPLVMLYAAGIATLDVLARGDVHPHLETLGAQMEAGLNQVIDRSGADACVQRVGSMITLFFVGGPVRQVDDVTPAATERFGAFWRHMLDHGVMLPPSQYEAWFLNGAMNAENVDEVVQAAGAFFSAAT